MGTCNGRCSKENGFCRACKPRIVAEQRFNREYAARFAKRTRHVSERVPVMRFPATQSLTDARGSVAAIVGQRSMPYYPAISPQNPPELALSKFSGSTKMLHLLDRLESRKSPQNLPVAHPTGTTHPQKIPVRMPDSSAAVRRLRPQAAGIGTARHHAKEGLCWRLRLRLCSWASRVSRARPTCDLEIPCRLVRPLPVDGTGGASIGRRRLSDS